MCLAVEKNHKIIVKYCQCKYNKALYWAFSRSWGYYTDLGLHKFDYRCLFKMCVFNLHAIVC